MIILSKTKKSTLLSVTMDNSKTKIRNTIPSDETKNKKNATSAPLRFFIGFCGSMIYPTVQTDSAWNLKT